MPIEAVQQFLTQVQSDEALQKELAKALEAENDREAVTQLAQSKGYNFSPDELWAEVQKRQNEAQTKSEIGELSDEELETVAGGEVLAGFMIKTMIQNKTVYESVKETIDKAPPVKW